QKIPVVDLPVVRLVAPGHAGDLNVADVWQPLAQFGGQVPLDDLRVIEVHLYLDIRRAGLFADRVRFGLGIQKVARDVAGIDRLDGEHDALLGGFARGEAKIAHEGRALPRTLLAEGVGRPTGHDVHPRAGERLRVGERGDEAGCELVLASGKRGQ